jgi:hypothetical protein
MQTTPANFEFRYHMALAVALTGWHTAGIPYTAPVRLRS